jgi:hypothetical protein
VVWLRAGLAAVVAIAIAAALVSGGSPSDPRSPAGLPGLPPPFLGVAVVGSGELTAAVDAYGNLVDLRPSSAGRALVEVPAARLAAGTVPASSVVVPRVRLGGGRVLPLWRADSVRQHYLPGTNALVTTARFGAKRVNIACAAHGSSLACLTGGAPVALHVPPEAETSIRCDDVQARRIFRAAVAADRRWLSEARPLSTGAPAWGWRAYERSLLVLRALSSSNGATAAGARDGWAYVWPRDAGTAALAFAGAGYDIEARRIAHFLLGLDLNAAARFDGRGEPVPGRAAQGDATGWVAIAARAVGLPIPTETYRWRDRADYQEKSPGDHLANAIAAGETPTAARLLRESPRGADSAAAWAVRPFSLPALHTPVRRSLQPLLSTGSHFGIVPSADWPEADPWTAPTAWTAWSLAALGDRREALRLLAALRRAATPAGDLPERVDAVTGLPRSTTPLAWSHAFAILALRELWPTK